MNEQVSVGDVVRVTHPDAPDFLVQGEVSKVYTDGDIRLRGLPYSLIDGTMGRTLFLGAHVEVIRRAKRELPTEEGIYYAELPNEKHGSGLIYKRLFKRKFDGWFDVADEAQTEMTEFLEERLNGSNPWTLVRLVPEQ